MQTDELLKGYVNRIQELEFELQQLQHARIPSDTSSRPPSSTSSRSMGESTAGPGFGVAGIDGDIYLRPGIRYESLSYCVEDLDCPFMNIYKVLHVFVLVLSWGNTT